MADTTTSTATWPAAASFPVLRLIKEAFAATPLGLLIAAFRDGR